MSFLGQDLHSIYTLISRAGGKTAARWLANCSRRTGHFGTCFKLNKLSRAALTQATLYIHSCSHVYTQSLVEAPRVSGSAPTRRAAGKKAAKDVDTVGESDLSDDEDWLAEALEADEPETKAPSVIPASHAAQPGNSAAQAPTKVAPPAAAAMLQSLPKATAFEEEDDYDAEDAPQGAQAGPAAVPGSNAALPLPVAPPTLPVLPGAHTSSLPAAAPVATAAAAASGSQAQAESSAAQASLMQSQAVASVPSASHTASISAAVVTAAAQAQTLSSDGTGHKAATQPQTLRVQPKTVEEQMQAARAKGASLPVLVTSDGRYLLKFSDLMPSVDALPQVQQSGHTDAISRAKLRAERLNALKAQTSTDKARAIAAARARSEDSDDESFFHVAARGKLPEHLVDSSMLSQESDVDVVMHEVDSQEQQSAQSEAKAQHGDRQLHPQTR